MAKKVTKTITAQNTFTDPIFIKQGDFLAKISGSDTPNAIVVFQRTTDTWAQIQAGTATWHDELIVSSVSGGDLNTSLEYSRIGTEAGVTNDLGSGALGGAYWRGGVKTGGYTGGTHIVNLEQ